MDDNQGTGETGLDRKVVIPVKDAVGFFLPTAKLEEDLPLRAHATRRQAGEDLHVEVFLDSEDAKRFKIEPEIAKFVKIVCYSADALLENNGERSTDCDWEIVAILGSKGGTRANDATDDGAEFLRETWWNEVGIHRQGVCGGDLLSLAARNQDKIASHARDRSGFGTGNSARQGRM